MAKLSVNGTTYEIEVDDDTPLLWALRDIIGLTGTKFGCGFGACGACTVHIDGVAVRSCQIPASEVADSRISTIESFGTEASHPVQRAWIEEQVPQCGYCQPGMIMATTALLAEIPDPTEDDIDLAITNICRCGTYGRVKKAIKRAVAIMQAEQDPLPPAQVPAGGSDEGTDKAGPGQPA